MVEDIIPLVNDIESAFSIENVTKEFLLKYKELYEKLKESLERTVRTDSYVKREFEEKNISVIDFAKKLLGQIVFIYFLQNFFLVINLSFRSSPASLLFHIDSLKILFVTYVLQMHA